MGFRAAMLRIMKTGTLFMINALIWVKDGVKLTESTISPVHTTYMILTPKRPTTCNFVFNDV
jgi:hypothetical protein